MFKNLGDMAGMMKKAKEMKSNISKMQSEMADYEASSSSSDGIVDVCVSGDFTVKQIKINCDSDNLPEKQILENSIAEAVNSALLNVKQKGKDALSDATGGIDLPGMSGMPGI